MNPLRKEFLCPCCDGVGVHKDKFACQAYKTRLGKTRQCSIEGVYKLDGLYYCGNHLNQAIRKQTKLMVSKLNLQHEQQTQ
jgi:hypothetical protein